MIEWLSEIPVTAYCFLALFVWVEINLLRVRYQYNKISREIDRLLSVHAAEARWALRCVNKYHWFFLLFTLRKPYSAFTLPPTSFRDDVERMGKLKRLAVLVL